MAKKSDPARSRRVTATEASRSFASILDQVEKGRRFVVQRHGEDVCVIAPPETTQRRTVSQCAALMRELTRGRPRITLDDKFGEDLLAIINMKRPVFDPWES